MLFGLHLHLKAEILGRFPSAADGERAEEHSKIAAIGNGYFG
jgi:hypothetical protein